MEPALRPVSERSRVLLFRLCTAARAGAAAGSVMSSQDVGGGGSGLAACSPQHPGGQPERQGHVQIWVLLGESGNGEFCAVVGESRRCWQSIVLLVRNGQSGEPKAKFYCASSRNLGGSDAKSNFKK